MNQMDHSAVSQLECYLTDIKKTDPIVAKRICTKIHRHPDIEGELLNWIATGAYAENGVTVLGYSAQALAALPGGPQGFAAYTFLVTLREKPDDALEDIRTGFIVK